ncbi:type II toxin-antitoxin system VapC family toxin [Occallatibacter savannae]|uniref:type II toxin-antitoxin system VapC family toxin n=1 Tax=Occallatibacter savannae TaxID=1002691 RepID=UPI000D69CA4B|nr:type II toxin-antitoxin system VapC family toxin [Occallatibacter savannae]
MKTTADTNILLRGALADDPRQSATAAHLLRNAELIAVPVSALCEFVWVLRQGYKWPFAQVAESLRALLSSPNVVTNYAVAEAGLTMLEAGGDFTDGVLQTEGEWLGGQEFVSFDRKAVTLLKEQGKRARLLQS